MRITKQIKAIADAHIAAKASGKFDDIPVATKEEAIFLLLAGKTFSEVLRQVEVRYCSIGSILSSNLLENTSDNYRKGVYNGFKTLLQK